MEALHRQLGLEAHSFDRAEVFGRALCVGCRKIREQVWLDVRAAFAEQPSAKLPEQDGSYANQQPLSDFAAFHEIL